MRKIELSPEAADDILGIWDYIARFNLPAADRIRDKFHDHPNPRANARDGTYAARCARSAISFLDSVNYLR